MKSSYDVIIIGGGATGSGLALDSSLRGYKTLLLEKYDFAYGTSSKSTKLVHGGVRYLEKAIKTFNIGQFNLVKEGLKERSIFLNNASHLAHPIQLLTPIYSYFEALYIYTGLFLYDFISQNKSLGQSSFISKEKLLKTQPLIKSHNLKGAVSYFDGSFNDSRMVISLIKSAKTLGCEARNYSEVTEFIYKKRKIIGVKIFDRKQKEYKEIYSNVIINAAGTAVDKILSLDNPHHKEILKLTSGIHIVVSKKYISENKALLIPKTEDGRVIFILPWQDSCLIGTTEEDSKFCDNPLASEKEISYLLQHVNDYFNTKLTRKDILSTFSGLRPLLKVNTQKESSSLLREHKIFHSSSNLITIAGGKWTTYRKMAEETLDYIIKEKLLPFKKECGTKTYKIDGSNKPISLQNLEKFHINEKIKCSLIRLYGSKAIDILTLSCKENLSHTLHHHFDFIEAELIYSIRNEFVQKPNDFLIRRINLGRVNIKAAKEALSRVVELMSNELSWNNEETLHHYQEALGELNELL